MFFLFLERSNSSSRQDQSLHPEDGEGGRDQGEDVPGDHRGLPHLLGAALLRHPGQLGLGLGGC